MPKNKLCHRACNQGSTFVIDDNNDTLGGIASKHHFMCNLNLALKSQWIPKDLSNEAWYCYILQSQKQLSVRNPLPDDCILSRPQGTPRRLAIMLTASAIHNMLVEDNTFRITYKPVKFGHSRIASAVGLYPTIPSEPLNNVEQRSISNAMAEVGMLCMHDFTVHAPGTHKGSDAICGSQFRKKALVRWVIAFVMVKACKYISTIVNNNTNTLATTQAMLKLI